MDAITPIEVNHIQQDGTLSATLARFALGLDWDAIPATVRTRAKHLMLDAIGIAYASAAFPFATATHAALAEFGSGASPVIGQGRTLSLRDAMLLNGVLIHGLDYDDTHSRGVVHATTSALPCVLGLADHLRRDGRALLAAYVAAMEVTTRLGAVAKGGFHQVGFHPTGLVGAFGCALAAARLMDLDAGRAAMAQGIALSMAAGSLEFLQDGAWTKRLHPGWAAMAGLTAAMLAKHGFTGPRAAYEGRFGLYASHLGAHSDQSDLALATEALGERWEIEEVAIKPIPACHFVHGAADAAMALHRAHAPGADAIRRVRVLVPEAVVKTVCEPLANKRAPANAYDAQFSIPYAVAIALLRGRFTLDELEDAALSDPAVLALAQRVEYAADPASTFPRHYTGEVILELEDGSTLRHREAVNRGCADRPLSNGDIAAKYLDNATRVLSHEHAERVRDAVLDLDQAGADAGALADVLAAPRAASA